MGDNITREKTVGGGTVIDEWKSTGPLGTFDITIESLDPGDCDVRVQVVHLGPAASPTNDFITVSSANMLASGPHRTVVVGVLGASIKLFSLPATSGAPDRCHVKYTFKWSS